MPSFRLIHLIMLVILVACLLAAFEQARTFRKNLSASLATGPTVAVSNDGTRIAIQYFAGRIDLYDQNLKRQKRITISDPESPIHSYVFSAEDSNWLYCFYPRLIDGGECYVLSKFNLNTQDSQDLWRLPEDQISWISLTDRRLTWITPSHQLRFVNLDLSQDSLGDQVVEFPVDRSKFNLLALGRSQVSIDSDRFFEPAQLSFEWLHIDVFTGQTETIENQNDILIVEKPERLTSKDGNYFLNPGKSKRKPAWLDKQYSYLSDESFEKGLMIFHSTRETGQAWSDQQVSFAWRQPMVIHHGANHYLFRGHHGKVKVHEKAGDREVGSFDLSVNHSDFFDADFIPGSEQVVVVASESKKGSILHDIDPSVFVIDYTRGEILLETKRPNREKPLAIFLMVVSFFIAILMGRFATQPSEKITNSVKFLQTLARIIVPLIAAGILGIVYYYLFNDAELTLMNQVILGLTWTVSLVILFAAFLKMKSSAPETFASEKAEPETEHPYAT